MFEKYQFNGVYIAIQAVLTLYAQGNFFIYCPVVTINVYCLYLHYTRNKEALSVISIPFLQLVTHNSLN